MPDLNGAQFDDSYRYTHRVHPEYSAPMHDIRVRGRFPSNAYDNIDRYTHGDRELHQQVTAARGNPDAPVRVYRALPREHKEIQPGNWVTPSLEYAKLHAQTQDDPSSMHVVSTTVPAKHLATEGNSLNEWGYMGRKTQQGRVAWKSRAKPRSN